MVPGGIHEEYLSQVLGAANYSLQAGHLSFVNKVLLAQSQTEALEHGVLPLPTQTCFHTTQYS
jgi:hypothetical protein